jgi:NitT/TauT family transport system substrate-binding protein
VWFGGNEYPFLSWMSTLGFSTDGSSPDVTVLKQGFNVDPILQKQASCISTMTYNEYWQIIDAGIPEGELTVFKYQDYDVATLEDGLYATEKTLADPAMVEKLGRFLRASAKGWAYAAEHPDEAVEIILANDATGAQTEEHQARMLGEVNKLLEGGAFGQLDPAAYERTVKVLMQPGSAPVISKAPEGATTDVVWKAAFGG